MKESQITPHPLDELAPVSTSPGKRSKASEHASLFAVARSFFSKYPDVCILAVVVLVNVLILGPVTGYGWEPSRIFQWSSLAARPFCHTWASIDAAVFGFTSVQVVLLTIWACFSERLILTRIAGWAVAVTTLAVVLLATINPDYSTLELLLLFGWLCLGTVLPSLFFRIGGWRTELNLPGAERTEKRQFAIRELMLLSLLVGVLCAIVAVLASLSYSFWWGSFLARESRSEYFWVVGIRNALIGSCSGFAFIYMARSSPRGLIRVLVGICLCVAACSALVLAVEIARENVYLQGTPPNYSTLGQYVWVVTHFGLMAGAVLVARPLGLKSFPPARHETASSVPSTRVGGWIRITSRFAILALVLSPILLGLWRAADYYRLYRLNQVVSEFGTLAKEPRNNGKWSVYLEQPIDAEALAVLNDNSSITDLYIMSRDQVDAESLGLMKQLKYVKRIVGYNNALLPSDVSELAASLPGVQISR